MTILDEIISSTRSGLKERASPRSLADLKARVADMPTTRGFRAALSNDKRPVRIIAEIKKASPSKGVIRPDFEPVSIASIYENKGAAAISVLTEERYFQGSLEYLAAIRKMVTLPLLRKDFMVDRFQVYEARAFGADAILLIAACLSKSQMEDLAGVAGELGLDVLTEVHNYRELDVALQAGAVIIGINNRDLHTFKTDIATTLNLLRDIPGDKIVVSESGINTRDDIDRLRVAGVHAFLIGEALMREADIGAKLQELLS